MNLSGKQRLQTLWQQSVGGLHNANELEQSFTPTKSLLSSIGWLRDVVATEKSSNKRKAKFLLNIALSYLAGRSANGGNYCGDCDTELSDDYVPFQVERVYDQRYPVLICISCLGKSSDIHSCFTCKHCVECQRTFYTASDSHHCSTCCAEGRPRPQRIPPALEEAYQASQKPQKLYKSTLDQEAKRALARYQGYQ